MATVVRDNHRRDANGTKPADGRAPLGHDKHGARPAYYHDWRAHRRGAGLSALAGSTALPATLAFVGLGLATMRTFLDPEKTLQAYNAKAIAYVRLVYDTKYFRNLTLRTTSLPEAELRDALNALFQRFNALTEQPPARVPAWAYRRAIKSLEAGQPSYRDDPHWEEPPF